MEFVLLATGETDWEALTLGDGLSHEDVFDTGAYDVVSRIQQERD